MARIRSIHPGIWTDEEFISVSMAARLAFIGLMNEADDGGVFPWKPKQLKARILACDDVDMVEILDELGRARFLMKFEVDGEWYGAIRNFVRYQSPQKPKIIYPCPIAVQEWVETGRPSVSYRYDTSTIPVSSGKEVERKGSGEEGSGQCARDPEPDQIPIAFAAYNRMALKAGLSQASSLSPKRRGAIRARLKECGGLDGWNVALEKVAASDFCTGQRGEWRADLDFILQASSFTKILEGSYDNHKPVGSKSGKQTALDSITAAVSRAIGTGDITPDDFRGPTIVIEGARRVA